MPPTGPVMAGHDLDMDIRAQTRVWVVNALVTNLRRAASGELRGTSVVLARDVRTETSTGFVP